MTEVLAGTPAPVWLDAEASARLERRLEAVLRRARSTGSATIASLTATIAGDVDPTAVVIASRRTAEPWVCLEQPDRDSAALATLGCARAIEARGQGASAIWRPSGDR